MSEMTPDWNWIGARWWKFDCHAHTPKSECYGQGPNQTVLRERRPIEWLLDYMRAEIDCLAVTDHNSGEGIDKLKNVYEQLQKEQHSDFRPLCIFPGVELTVNGNIHILGIFPREYTTSDINSVVDRCRYRGTKGRSDGCTDDTAVKVIEEIVNSGGIAIPAHVDKDCGLFIEMKGTTLSPVLDSPHLFAVELVNCFYTLPAMYHERKLKWSKIVGSDQHHPSGSNEGKFPASHFTWVKMSEPSLDGLKLALIDGDISLKRSDEYSGNPNNHGVLVIESITIENAKFIGRNAPFCCRFNPWLNTIIGGRGTGKSTIIEFLRIILNRKDELPSSIEESFAKYSRISSNRDDDGLLTANSVFTVFYRKNGSRFRIKWSVNSERHQIEKENSPGEWVPSEGDIKQRFPVRIYSQKQIFELAKHPQALLRIIDDAPEVNFHDWELEWNELISKYLSIRAQEREILAGLQEESFINGQLDDVKHKLEVFENAGHAEVLKSYRFRQDQHKAIETWEKSWDNTAEEVRFLAETLIPEEIDSQHFAFGGDEDKELIDEISQTREAFQDIKVIFLQIAEQIDELRNKWLDRKDSLLIIKKISSANHDYVTLLEQLSEIGADDPSEYKNLVKQRQEFEEKLNGLNKKRETLREFQKKAEEYLKQIHEHRSRITLLRDKFLKSTLECNSYVQINIIPYGDKTTVEEKFRNLIERRSGGFDKDIGTVNGDEGLLSLLYQNSDLTMENKIQNLKNFLFLINKNEVEAFTAAKDQRFVAHIQRLDPEKMDRLQCWYPDDSLEIQFRLKDRSKFRPIEEGSPGQKTAALLAFILSYGNEPLILDQPEDDLDNHLIYDLIVAQLRDIKRLRQIIVVTHNANIVVNGDAENVVALDIRSGQTKAIAQDCLQKLSIRKEICHVMEGGEEAFDLRYTRINAGRHQG